MMEEVTLKILRQTVINFLDAARPWPLNMNEGSKGSGVLLDLDVFQIRGWGRIGLWQVLLWAQFICK